MNNFIINPYAIPGLPRHDYSIEAIFKTVLSYYGLPEEAVKSKSRIPHLVEVRQMVWLICIRIDGVSRMDLAKLFGMKDRGGVTSGIRHLEAMLQTDSVVLARYKDLCLLIGKPSFCELYKIG